MSYPFQYSDDDWIDLGALTTQQYADLSGRSGGWARGVRAQRADRHVVPSQGSERGVSGGIAYQSREDEGTQSPTRP